MPSSPIVMTNSWVKRARNSPPFSLLAALVLSCGGAGAQPVGTSVPHSAAGEAGDERSRAALRVPVDFAFDSLDDRPISAVSTRGKPTLVTFLTTSNLAAQAQIDFLVAMARNDGDKVNYAAVALEPHDNRELVELYKKALSIQFPVAMADPLTLAGGGPFGDVSAVPVTVLLDRSGRIVWRTDGRVVKSSELRDALKGL